MPRWLPSAPLTPFALPLQPLMTAADLNNIPMSGRVYIQPNSFLLEAEEGTQLDTKVHSTGPESRCTP